MDKEYEDIDDSSLKKELKQGKSCHTLIVDNKFF